MYKISEVAEMLSVEKVKIVEALIVNDEVLSPYVSKERHLSYISEDGVREIERIIFNLGPEPKSLIVELDIEDEEEIVIDELAEMILICEDRKASLKNEIIDLKRKLNVFDKDIRHRDDAILNYQKIMYDDMNWLVDLELKVSKKRQILENKPVIENKPKVEPTEPVQKKQGFLNKFMK